MLIQRLLVFHCRLAEICTGETLDEAAGGEDLSEPILFYYDSTDTSIVESQPDFRSVVDKAAVQFLGLCCALYSLPKTLDPGHSNQNNTTEVTLESSSLYFLALDGPDILGVAQVARSTSAGGAPSAVGAALLKSYELFRILRGGGIRRRLCARYDEGEAETSCVYGGMDKLYQSRKRLRRLEELARLEPSPTTALQLEALHEEIQHFYQKSPISILKKELDVHFSSFLHDFSANQGYSRNCCQNVLESLPSAHAYVTPQLDAYVLIQLSKSIRRLMDEISAVQAGSKVRLLGVITFYLGILQEINIIASQVKIKTESVCQLMSYFSKFRTRIIRQTETSSAMGMVSPQRLKHGIRSLSMSLGNDQGAVRPQITVGPTSGFLSLPPLSMLSSLDETEHNFGDSPIWVIPVSLPDETGDFVDAQACAYFIDGFSFVILLSPDSTVAGCRALCAEMDKCLSVTVKEFCVKLSPENNPNDGFQKIDLHSWEEPGIDLIFVDRARQAAIVGADTSSQDRCRNERRKIEIRDSYRMAKNNPMSQCSQPKERMMPLRYDDVDGRCLLSSTLSVDSLLALEDAFEEIQHFRKTREMQCDTPFELSTFLMQKWIYTFADADTELYLLLDAAQYITLADVQKSTARIRQELQRIV